jgi:iron(III) transport system substrate-binding protein
MRERTLVWTQQRATFAAIVVLAVTSLLLAACGQQPARPAAPAAPAAGGPAAPAGQSAPAAPPGPLQAAMTMPLDELHQKALAEGSKLVFYATLAQINAEKILPAFEARFPGVKVEHIDATSDKLVARVIAESRGGRVLGDVFQVPMDTVAQVNQRGLLLQEVPPEAQEYPDTLRGAYWVASDLQFIIAAWNTNLVRPDEVPRQFEDFADPKWRNRLIAEPRDVELLAGLALRKYNNDDQAIDLIRKIAANNVEFHPGHSELAELLAAGQAAACLTCYSHHYPSRIRRGAPLDYMLTEGIGLVNGTAVFKDAPHPHTAVLWMRWVTSEEGQQAYAEGGRTPAHPKVEPRDKTRPDRVYALSPEEVSNLSKYERPWKEIFQLR